MIGNGTHKHYRWFLFHNHCHAHWCAHRPRPSNIWKQDSTRLAVTVTHGLRSSQYSPATAASVMARSETLFIATVTVLVILAAALQPGEHYLTASICTCTYTNYGLCQCNNKKSVCKQSESAGYPQCFSFFFACRTLWLKFIMRTTAFMLAADCYASWWLRCTLPSIMVAIRHASEHHGGYKARFR